MSNTLSALRQATNDYDKLMNAVEKMSSAPKKNGGADDRIWKPTPDSRGNGECKIRFLPFTEGEENNVIPVVKIWDHGFQGPTGKWYIEKSLTTIGQQDPVSELNSQLWNSGSEANKETARKQKRRLSYYANILVVDDPAHPENNGKVFLYKFGKKIYDMLEEQFSPRFESDEPNIPWDVDNGKVFVLRMSQVAGYRSYDKSFFASETTPLASTDEEIESIWKKQYKLNELVDPSTFKSYEELSQKLQAVLGTTSAAPVGRAEELTSVDEDYNVEVSVDVSDDDEDTMSYFSKLAED
jgi:hypothetical protein